MEEIPLKESPYSHHFEVLTRLGVWILETRSPFKKNAYFYFESFMMALAALACFLFYMDLYSVIGDVKKMTWNLCISIMFTGWVTKHFLTFRNNKVINSLRKKLHEKVTSRRAGEEDDEEVNRLSAKELRKIEIVYYSAAVIFIPIWFLSLYFGLMWGERDIPVPIWIPFEVDYQDELQFNILFAAVSAGGVTAIVFVMSVELSMFTILIQISREYERLLKDLPKINELCEGRKFKKSGREMNPYLREMKIRMLLKEFIIRQQELIEYTEGFELSYRYPMLLELFVSSFALVLSGFMCLTEYDNMSLNITYELGYLSMILMDMLLFCSFVTRIRSQCFRVGEVAYSVMWYRMGIDIQKDISLIIMRSQRPPKITSGKVIEMDLSAYLSMIKNIYSWLTLFRQLAFKSD